MRWDPAARFRKQLESVKNVVIVTHWSPDGDAIGSSLGLYHYLLARGLKPTVIVPNAYPDFLHWMAGDKKVLNFQEREAECLKRIEKADLIFTLDFNTYKRLEVLGKVLEKAACPKVLIDHHQAPDDYAKFVFHDVKASSTCELIYRLIAHLGDEKLIDKKIAACLYTGIMTDTGSFKYSSVNAFTHQVVSKLLEKGIKPTDIHSAVYDSYSENRLRLLGFALSEKMKVHPSLPVAYFVITAEELKKFNFMKGDLEGIVNYPFAIKGIEVTAMISETDGQVKVSFRSKGKRDVNQFARSYFNGGGHINAAGGRSFESPAGTERTFLDKVSTLF